MGAGLSFGRRSWKHREGCGERELGREKSQKQCARELAPGANTVGTPLEYSAMKGNILNLQRPMW